MKHTSAQKSLLESDATSRGLERDVGASDPEALLRLAHQHIGSMSEQEMQKRISYSGGEETWREWGAMAHFMSYFW